MNANARWATVSLGLLVFLATPALANYSIIWETRQDGHLKMWWTTNGIRDADPFVDIDIQVAPNTYRLGRIAPRKDINDCHDQWILAGNNKSSTTSVLAGVGYPFPTFEDFFVASPFDEVTWYGLADEQGLNDVEVTIDLVVWGDHLQHNPLPDPNSLYLFDASGLCLDLPGYEATNATAGTPFAGEMMIASQSTLSIFEPLQGDADLDGDVDLQDLSRLASNWNATEDVGWGEGNFDGAEAIAYGYAGDMGDHDVDLIDLSLMASNWLAGTTTESTVPEPATMLLLTIGGLGLLGRRRR